MRRWFFRIAAVIVILGAIAYFATRRDPLVTLPKNPSPTLLVRNVRVIDVVSDTATAARDVWIEGDRIARITAHDPAATLPPGIEVINGQGLTMIPGLIDIHCHTESVPNAPWDRGIPDVDLNLERLLYSGVTRLLDPGSRTPDVFELRAAVAAGRTLGPTIHTAGPIFTAIDGHPAPMMRESLPGFIADSIIEASIRQIGSDADARREVDALALLEPDVVKIAIDRIPLSAPRLSPDLARAVVDAAKKHGLRTVAHVGTTTDAMDAGRAGVSAWMHGVYKERLTDREVQALAAFRIPMAPTLVVFRAYADVGRGKFASTALERDVASVDMLDARIDRPEGFEVSAASTELLDLLRTQQQNALDNVRRLHAAGVVMMAGSDAQPSVLHGPGLHRELGLLRDAGLPPIEVLRAATLYPARFLANAEDPPFGVVATGKRADLVLVRGDPLGDVQAVANIHSVILGGRRLERHGIGATQGDKRR